MGAKPPQCGSGRPIYRRSSAISLALFLLTLFFPCFLPAAEKPLTRLELVEICVSRFEGRFVDEIEAIRSGLLAPYPDGHIHLDWPATRGVAAGAMARLAITRGLPARPACFQDVGPSSPLAPSLAQVGEVFPPLDQDRFRAEQLVFRGELEGSLAALATPPQTTSSSLQLTEGLAPGTGDFVGGRRYPADYAYPGGASRPDPAAQTGTDTGPIGQVAPGVPLDQMTPQGAFDLGQAQEGIEEIESRLDPLEVNVYDLVGITDANPEEERKITSALTVIHQVINDSLGKLAFAQRQLNTAILADPDAIRNALDLKARLAQDVTRLERIRQRIEPRLRRTPTPTTEQEP